MDEKDVERIRQIADPVERSKAAQTAQVAAKETATELSHIRNEAVEELLLSGMKQADIARLLDMTTARLSQIAKGSPGPERAFLAPKTSPRPSVTVAVVRKADTERNGPSVTDNSLDAVMKIQSLAQRWDIQTKVEKIPSGGGIDLNRDNLVVLMSPRVSPVVAMAITADPIITWRTGENGRWHIIDSATNSEYHSDFDRDTTASSDTRHCYAHIGRIRRPDGNGSFLYLSGIHREGTTGAVEVLVRDIAALWTHARRNLWSAVVRTTVDSNDEILSAEIATPVYVHGKVK